jgi:hypothetical protein
MWKCGCRAQCARFGLRVCEWSTEGHAACTGNVFINKRVKTHMMQGWMSNACYKWARAIGFSEGRGPIWPFRMHHVDRGFGMLRYVLVPTTPAPRGYTSGIGRVNQ